MEEAHGQCQNQDPHKLSPFAPHNQALPATNSELPLGLSPAVFRSRQASLLDRGRLANGRLGKDEKYIEAARSHDYDSCGFRPEKPWLGGLTPLLSLGKSVVPTSGPGSWFVSVWLARMSGASCSLPTPLRDPTEVFLPKGP